MSLNKVMDEVKLSNILQGKMMTNSINGTGGSSRRTDKRKESTKLGIGYIRHRKIHV
jgi:hypothetical protein